jgi:hypothetical protein
MQRQDISLSFAKILFELVDLLDEVTRRDVTLVSLFSIGALVGAEWLDKPPAVRGDSTASSTPMCSFTLPWRTDTSASHTSRTR